ncbi:hypothetical protein K437DRAFT_255466 [Tilletiaria anomala UBC 951]|uniref:K Homology domain-containing protein n=1 Tax=Tilletiaria anomala (strain ATCC 24038 / CBS 436.72 / UBC 951) TaxID=1037660 RepID=A0A066WCJ5_TILAU|nr:uncharacterized protein K437DRAFT_255466 [Tilletiaria anomala UBC 951]KDN48495.1 hypothetical protein K437DRAFT_255466 [Tilletiaria anomala UBC 951]
MLASNGISAAELQRQHILQQLQSPFASEAGATSAQATPMADPFPSLGDNDADVHSGADPSWGPGASGSGSTKATGSSQNAANGSSKEQQKQRQSQPDFNSESAFPTLGAAAAKPAASSSWSRKLSTAGGSNGNASSATAASAQQPPASASQWHSTTPVIQRNVVNETFSLPSSPELVSKLPGVLTRIRAKFGGPSSAVGAGLGAAAGAVTIEASTTRKTNTTTFILKGSSEKTIKAAKKELSVALAKSVTLTIMIPASLRAFVIGAKGKNLKTITDQTGVRINIPKPDEGSGDAAAAAAANGDYDADEQVPVTIEGDEINARNAQSMLQAIVAERTSKITQRLSHIDHVFYPFIAGPKGSNAAKLEQDAALGAGIVSVRVPPRAAFLSTATASSKEGKEGAGEERGRDLSIIVTGDREAVARVVAAIEAQVDNMRRNLRTLAIQIPKRQHRFLVGDNATEVLATTGCSIELAPIDDPSDSVTIRGPAPSLAGALTAVMQKANSVQVQTVDLVAAHRSIDHARDLVRWLSIGIAPSRLPRGSAGGVQVFAPRSALLETTGQAAIEIVGGDAHEVGAVRDHAEELVRRVSPACIVRIDIDPLLHRHIIGKKGANLKQYEVKGVDLVFPPASEHGDGSAEVLLVYSSGAAAAGESDKKARDAHAQHVLADVKADVLKASVHAADIHSETLHIPQKFHRHILGPNGTTLNALIGEERNVAVKVGPGKGAAAAAGVNGNGKVDGEDAVIVRGPSAEVQRVVQELQRIAQEAEQDIIVNGHVAEFYVDAAHVPHLVGKGGAAVTKLREELGIRIDFTDPVAASGGGATAVEGKKKGSAKAKVTLTGRKENVEEAKKRLQAQVEKLADETSIVVKVPVALHGQIIGQGGKYVTRLQETYAVRINFPNASANAAGGGSNAQRPDEVVIKGGKKGVEGARAELVELVAYEQENNNVSMLKVSSKAVARILGRGGVNINQIRDDTGTQIDIDRDEASKDAELTTINIRGSKKAIEAAKKEINAIVSEVDAEESYRLHVPVSLHGQLIGAQGQAIRDLIIRAGGPEDSRAAAQHIIFPRKGDMDTDTVIVRGPAALASKLKAELEAAVEQASNRANELTLGVHVLQTQHSQLIGRAGARLKELEAKHNVRISLPGSRLYASAPEASNQAELGDAAPETIVKVRGAEAACRAAIEEISSSLASASRSVQVPRSVHGKLASPNFLRNLRSNHGVSVDLPRNLPAAARSAASSARIDADEAEDEAAATADGLAFELEELDLGDSGAADAVVEWKLTGKDAAALDKAEAQIRAELAKAKSASHEGRLTLPQSAVPRIIGKQGSGLHALQAETGTDIQIPRDGGGLCIIRGSKEAVLEARERIEEIAER